MRSMKSVWNSAKNVNTAGCYHVNEVKRGNDNLVALILCVFSSWCFAKKAVTLLREKLRKKNVLKTLKLTNVKVVWIIRLNYASQSPAYANEKGKLCYQS